MSDTSYIAKFKLSIAIVGIIVGLSILAGPILSHVMSDSVPVVQISSEDDDSNSQESDTSNQLLASIEALAPAIQVQFDFGDVLLTILVNQYHIIRNDFHQYFDEVPKKFFKVLFTWISAPNAP